MRQRRYQVSGIRGLWLLRQTGFPIIRELPAICIGGDIDSGFLALLPGCTRLNARDRSDPSRWGQSLAMDEFLNAAFSGRFQFGVPPGSDGTVTIWGAETLCWRCRAETLIMSRIEIAFGPHSTYFGLPEFGQFGELAGVLQDHIPTDLGAGPLRYRYSESLNERYLTNGCAHCGELYARFFAFDLKEDSKPLHRFPVRIDSRWERAINGCLEERWGVHGGQFDHKGAEPDVTSASSWLGTSS